MSTRTFFTNYFTWSIILAIISFGLYGYLHYKMYDNFDFYEGGTPAGTVFVTAANVSLLVKILSMEDGDLGKLMPDKAAVILGVTFAIFFGATDVAKSFSKFFQSSPASATQKSH